MGTRHVALVGDYNPSVIAHQAIPQALRQCGAESAWIHTKAIQDPEKDLADFDGVWCVPASPYANTGGALGAIRYARERDRPFLGTCGGFQHALIEYARHVRGIAGASHAETDPDAPLLLITPLACSLVEKSETIQLKQGSRIEAAYGAVTITEGYHCNYGLNREFYRHLFDDGLRPTASDEYGEVRAVELASHRFFVATLFQPERRALKGEVPPLVRAFVTALSK
jgi:CTP synthase (UTP-ammonia lyase)